SSGCGRWRWGLPRRGWSSGNGRAQRMPEATLLVEIGCEELPARQVRQLAEGLGAGLQRRLAEAQLIDKGQQAQAQWTPRRLIVVQAGVRERQPMREEEMLGPPAGLCRQERRGGGRAVPGANRQGRIRGIEAQGWRGRGGGAAGRDHSGGVRGAGTAAFDALGRRDAVSAAGAVGAGAAGGSCDSISAGGAGIRN